MFVVPVDVLDKLVCDFCHKYLSVGPVKVNEHGKKICGRCPNDGILSMSVFLLKHYVFKCNNRYDGCNALLNYADILEHEKICISREYDCPLCPNVQIPAYKLVGHFKKSHDENLLSDFFLNDKASKLISKKCFLYLKQNYMYFIFLKQTNNKLLLNAFYFGDEETMEQRFFVCIEGIKIFSSAYSNCLPFYKSTLTNRFRNTFEFNCKLDDNILIHFVPRMTNETITNDFDQMSISNVTNSLKGARKITSVKQYEEYLESKQVSISKDSKTILMKHGGSREIEIKPHCKVCKNIGANNIYITSYGSVRHLICQVCAMITDNEFCYLEHVLKDGLFIYCSFTGLFIDLKKHLNIEHSKSLYFNTFTIDDIKSIAARKMFTCFIWVQPNTFLKCEIEKYNSLSKDFTISTTHLESKYRKKLIIVVAEAKIDSSDYKYYSHFKGYGTIDFELLPIQLYFICSD